MKKRLFRNKFLTIASIIAFSVIFKCGNQGEEPKTFSGNSPRTIAVSPDALGGKCDQGEPLSIDEAYSLKKVIIILAAKDIVSYQKIEKAVKDLGGRVTVGISPEIILALIPPGKESRLGLLPEIRLISSQQVELEELKGITEKEKELLKTWNKMINKTIEPSLIPNPLPPPNDALERPPIKFDEIEVKPPKSLPSGMENGNTFIFNNLEKTIAPALTIGMSGKVVAMVIFPESNGAIDANRENWTGAQKTNVINEIVFGMDWWASLAPVDQTLSFELFFLADASYELTSYEPIKRPSTDEGLWINQIMTNLGYTSGNYYTKVDSFNTWLKGEKSADEAFSIFVVNDSVDSDNKFADNSFDYAYLGGPFMVLTYGGDGYGIANMDACFAHENGHIFHAWDEYGSSGCACAQSYNSCGNQNCENACLDDTCCIMRSQVDPYTNNCICDCTKGQIGWGCGACGAQGCSSGACCNLDNGLPKPPTSVCNTTGAQYACGKGKPKGKCGDDLYARQVTQYCSGTGTTCDGAIIYGEWTLDQACTAKQVCNAYNHTCKRKATCP